MTEALDSITYGSLLHEVQGLLEPDTVLRGEVERERVPRYWEVGRRPRFPLRLTRSSWWTRRPIRTWLGCSGWWMVTRWQ